LRQGFGACDLLRICTSENKIKNLEGRQGFRTVKGKKMIKDIASDEASL
jgi:hypothetical protein